MIIEQVYGYLMHLLTGFALVAAFALIYLRLTPYDEIALIRKAYMAPALSFGGTLIGFSVTVASGILHLPSYTSFLLWALVAMVIQLVAFVILSRLLPDLRRELEANNTAMGALIGSITLSIGLINGACLS